ncbi:tRNA pseudouridine(13) synthase TruD [Candidatus Woesearchaeota archaeon]|nr:tRNA pseudouridine(13) synthase TruD [Candidatus Woesearchaeota archaeon]
MHLKSTPEDFIVEEINTLHFNLEGKFSYYQLKKRDLESGSAIQQIADRWKINQKYINIAGNKDKIAVTTQFISISQGPEQNMKSDNLELTFLGKGKAALQLGHLEGNKFTIVVREITSEERKNFLEHIKNTKKKSSKLPSFVNYYDDQRFGNSRNNHLIGKHLVRKEFKEACVLITATTHYPQVLAKEHLDKLPTDFIGALRCLPKKVVLMYVHAYQSWLWNETAKLLITKASKKIHTGEYSAGTLLYPQTAVKNVRIPLIGFDIEDADPVIEKILQEMMKKEHITSRDFLPKQMPELLTAGGSRDLLIDCKNFDFKELDAETITVSFQLGKGSYATMVVKQLFG